ncbi:ABC transporter ATP-binding protein [Sulfurivirga sp.]|uniref:ABC transporter ATP-binding protein n=1 Tax=Sulfurivirga sp. TaxID=2614236 RepID=UPI0025F1518E|nr:ATP-binding cassette domain-containing protein [Sulfurivirga sp.]
MSELFALTDLSWPGRFSGVTLTLEAGERVALLGPNGAGKSSLLQAMAGLAAPLRGSLRLAGQPLHALPPEQQALHRAWLPQQTDAPPALTGEQLLGMGRLPGQAHDADRVEQIIDTLELAPLLPLPLGTLSGGEQQRLQLGRVLVQSWALRVDHPRALLLDEGLNALDVRHRMRLLNALTDWCDTGALSVVWISHDLTLAAQWAQRVWLMRAGQLLGEGRAETLTRKGLLTQAFDWPLTWRECDDMALLLPAQQPDA